jgi:hypothetical protein
MSAPWWVGVGPAESRVACGPNEHRIRWEDGTAVAVDHADPTAEALLVSIGAEEPTCLQLLRYWKAHRSDPRVLLLASRHPGDAITVGAEELARARQGQAEHQGAARRESARRLRPGWSGARPQPDNEAAGPLGPSALATAEQADRQLGLLELLSLDPSLQRRLQLEVAAHLAAVADVEQPSDPHGTPGGWERAASAYAVLEAATVGRIVPVIRRWSTGLVVDVVIGAPSGLATSDRGSVTLTVGSRWVADVWGRYLAAVGGFLVLEVNRIVDDRAEVTGLATPDGQPVRLLVRGPAPWRVIQRLGH